MNEEINQLLISQLSNCAFFLLLHLRAKQIELMWLLTILEILHRSLHLFVHLLEIRIISFLIWKDKNKSDLFFYFTEKFGSRLEAFFRGMRMWVAYATLLNKIIQNCYHESRQYHQNLKTYFFLICFKKSYNILMHILMIKGFFWKLANLSKRIFRVQINSFSQFWANIKKSKT